MNNKKEIVKSVLALALFATGAVSLPSLSGTSVSADTTEVAAAAVSIPIDGSFGPGSVVALQSYLNNLSDYWKGGMTDILALDGSFGPDTIMHLQAYLDMYFD